MHKAGLGQSNPGAGNAPVKPQSSPGQDCSRLPRMIAARWSCVGGHSNWMRSRLRSSTTFGRREEGRWG
jgi:hypothetical protein